VLDSSLDTGLDSALDIGSDSGLDSGLHLGLHPDLYPGLHPGLRRCVPLHRLYSERWLHSSLYWHGLLYSCLSMHDREHVALQSWAHSCLNRRLYSRLLPAISDVDKHS
jgi:hypothetical protein